jgi:hypothetical protein
MLCPSLAVPREETARLVVYRRGHPGRAQVEAFIQAVYAERFGATVTAFAPTLVTWETSLPAAAGRPGGSGDEAQAAIGAAAGYRAANEPLFLERYLDQPIQDLLTPPQEVARSGVVEVGHLTSVRPGDGRRLIVALAAHLADCRAEWVVSTITAELRQIVVRLGLGAVALAPARAERLGAEAASWGTYFTHQPIVMAGHLPTALRGLRRRDGLQA